jgi:transcription elongation GreA/GreB family factor
MRKFGKDSPIQVSALVRLRANDGKALTVFLGSGAGGETITVGGEEVNAISSCSPLGLAMQDKRVGDTFDMRIGKTMTSFTVLSVE